MPDAPNIPSQRVPDPLEVHRDMLKESVKQREENLSLAEDPGHKSELQLVLNEEKRRLQAVESQIERRQKSTAPAPASQNVSNPNA